MRRATTLLWSAVAGLVLAALVAGALSAQSVTTASFSGVVKDNNGQPVYGANVIATHVPSGTVFGAATRADGRYNIPFARVGGPYTVTVNFIGYKKETRENVMLTLGEDKRINFTLTEEAVEMAGVEIVVERNPIISESRTGAALTVTNDQITKMPTINRSFDDFTRLTPQFSGNSAVGRNNRYNNILIDGSVNNDLFGLAGSGTPGGQAGTTPISLDAIQEFQVELAPYDVRKGGFTGGGINAITRSGTNKYEGSVYTYGRNESFVGSGIDKIPVADFSETVYGFRVGGPIINDKLFFFVNGEYSKRNSPTNFGITGTGAANDFTTISGIDTAEAEQFKNALISMYNYNPGSYGIRTNTRPSTKFFVRFDYNISEKHQLIVRHNFINASDDILGRSTGTGSSNGFFFSNTRYKFANTTNSTVFQLNSAITNNLYNEAILAYQTIRDKRETPGRPFPTVRVTYGTSMLVGGTENFSQANALDQDIIEITDNLTYIMGDHSLTVGTHNELFNFENLFIRNLYGLYTFANFDSFLVGRPSAYELSYSLDSNKQRPTAKFGVKQLGFYLQDVWKIMPNMNLTAGIRFDVPILSDKPAYNERVDTTVFLDNIEINTNKVPSGNILISPRVGFNWDIFGNKKTQVRGGIGIFSGRTPYVWISNQYSNTGVEFGRIAYSGTNPNLVRGFFDPDPSQDSKKTYGLVTSEIDVTAKNFKLPQIWRFNIGADHELPYGFIGTIDFIASKNINAIRYQDINLKPATSTRNLSRSGDADGVVPVFSTSNSGKYNSNFTNVIYLSNTDLGYEYNLTLALQKNFSPGFLGEFDKGYFASIAYTLGRAVDENSGTSSQALSNFRYNPIKGDPNHTGSATANYEVRHRIISSLSYTLEFFPKFATTVSLFYSGTSGSPYSETYSGDANGDGWNSNDLVYVPKDRDDINIVPVTGDTRTADQIWEELNAYIMGDPALKKARGKIIDRNASRAPWINRVDLHLGQQIPLQVAPGNFELTMDLLNVMNWLNREWGQVKYVPNQTNSNIIYRGVIAGQPAFTFGTYSSSTGKVTYPKRYLTSDLASRWQFQLGIRYTF